jgi:hypothetical protein
VTKKLDSFGITGIPKCYDRRQGNPMCGVFVFEWSIWMSRIRATSYFCPTSRSRGQLRSDERRKDYMVRNEELTFALPCAAELSSGI